jgi:hypothetical protein
MTRRGLLLAALPFSLGAADQKIKLAGVPLEVLKNGRSKRRYLLIHGSEQTAREVLQAHMKTHKGIAHLVTGKQRNIPVEGGGQLDPNRMFSRVGAAKNLKTLNPSFTPTQIETILSRLDKQRGKLVKALLPPAGGLLVAVHNNSEGYSVEAEVPISDLVAINDKSNPHEFFLTVQERDYRVLAKSPYNVVLQNKVPPDDDGSLSRLAAKRGARYANLEVALGNSRKQKEMLEWLERNLP